jgi:hypothetical protein
MTRKKRSVRRAAPEPALILCGQFPVPFPETRFPMEPRQEEKKSRFQIEKLEERIAPTILQVNGGGNIPNGNANGVDYSNPAGNEPPGWNK